MTAHSYTCARCVTREAELESLRAKIAALHVELELAQRFHDVACKERDLVRVQLARADGEAERAIRELVDAKAQRDGFEKVSVSLMDESDRLRKRLKKAHAEERARLAELAAPMLTMASIMGFRMRQLGETFKEARKEAEHYVRSVLFVERLRSTDIVRDELAEWQNLALEILEDKS